MDYWSQRTKDSKASNSAAGIAFKTEVLVRVRAVSSWRWSKLVSLCFGQIEKVGVSLTSSSLLVKGAVDPSLVIVAAGMLLALVGLELNLSYSGFGSAVAAISAIAKLCVIEAEVSFAQRRLSVMPIVDSVAIDFAILEPINYC